MQENREVIEPIRGLVCHLCGYGDQLAWDGANIICESCDQVTFLWTGKELCRMDELDKKWGEV